MNSKSSPKIELQAIRMAIEWKNAFAMELQSAAQEAAEDCDVITVEHYRQALPIAASRVLGVIGIDAVETGITGRRFA